MEDFTTPVIDKFETKPEHYDIWGGKGDDYCDLTNDIIIDYNIIPLKLLITNEEEGITFSCPDLELAMCGSSEQEAWENFIEAYKDLLSFLSEHKDELSEDLKRRSELVKQPISFSIIRE